MKRFLSRIVEDVCFLLVIVLAAVVFFQVFNRFILKASMAWTEELAMFLFQWVVFLGAALGVKRMSHFGIDLMVEKLSEKNRHRLELVVPFAIGAIAVTLITEGIQTPETYPVPTLYHHAHLSRMGYGRHADQRVSDDPVPHPA